MASPYFPNCDIKLSNFSTYQQKTNLSAEQFDQYVYEYSKFQCLTYPILSEIGLVSFTLSGLVGLVSYAVMYATLRHVSISGCTMIYHKTTVIMELVHMVVMIQHGLLQSFKSRIPSSWTLVFWFSCMNNGWAIGDSIKLAISTLTTFLTLERFIAVCVSLAFNKFNRPCIAYAAVVCSLIVGSAHLWIIGTFDISESSATGSYVAVASAFACSDFYTFTLNFTYAAKVFLSVIIFGLCSATAIQLRRVAKKAGSMTSDARLEWSRRKRSCALVYILGMCLFVDHIFWVAFKVSRRSVTELSVDKVVTTLSFDQVQPDLVQKKTIAALELMQRLLGQLVHSWRFLIYLALNETMRRGLRKLMKRRVAPISHVRALSGVFEMKRLSTDARGRIPEMYG